MYFGQQQQKTSTLGVDHDKEAGKRREAQVTLRKKDKSELLEKRRRNVSDSSAMEASAGEPTNANLQLLAQKLHSESPKDVLEATTAIRQLLSAEDNPPIDGVIHANCVPKLVSFLQNDADHKLQFEACWALTNVASGTSEHTLVVIHAGAVPEFVRLLSSPSDDVREQSVWALGNIAGDSAKCRDLVLNHEALVPLLRIIHSEPKQMTLRNATWCLSNLFRGKPIPLLMKLEPALATLAQLTSHTDEDVVADALWAVSYASDGPNDRIGVVLSLPGIVPRLVEFLSETNHQILCPALRAVGNIVTGHDNQTQVMIDAGILPKFKDLMSHQKRNIKKECCWAISNILAGSRPQIVAVIENGLVPSLVYALRSNEYDVKKEALWAVCNLTSGGLPEHVYTVVQAGCLEPMVELLTTGDMKIILITLEGIEHILQSGQTIVEQNEGRVPNEYKNELINNGGVQKIEALQTQQDSRVSAKAISIMERFFKEETTMQPFLTDITPGLINFQ
ncbi:Importin subunit alpha-4 [Diplonema papillatum]|nr:Importin subunit alpha-4 [Diplonema papillatum]